MKKVDPDAPLSDMTIRLELAARFGAAMMGNPNSVTWSVEEIANDALDHADALIAAHNEEGI